MLFGAGKRCFDMLDLWYRRRWNLNFEMIVDNDEKRSGELVYGYPVVHPDEVKDWKDLFIIITVLESEGIEKQLKTKGLKKDVDYSLAGELFPDQAY